MKWLEPKPIDIPEQLEGAVAGHPLVAQALARRGVRSAEDALAFLDAAHYRPTSPFELPDMRLAVERLQAAIGAGEGILVWGDFDVDGLTATALLVEALRELGAEPHWYIPDRRTESHGVHWNSLQRFLGRGVRVLLTCDTGISAHQEVALAGKAGLDVLITDHHDLPPRIPSAHGVVNPKRLSKEHPL
ncbi:MAG: DHH family phosphoesterase, partial [Anaerolineales bacterium]